MLLIEERTEAPAKPGRRDRWRERLRDVALISGTISIFAGIILAIVLYDDIVRSDKGTAAQAAAAGPAIAAAPSASEGAGVKFEPFKRVNPDLPATPAGAVKRFKIDVYEHV